MPICESFLKTLSDQDDPSTRAYPVNASIVRHMRKILDTKHKTEGQANSHVIDLAIVGFFWLLRPSECLDSNAKTRSQAFRLCDIHFTVDGQQALTTTLTLNDENCRKITAATLTFSDQKSGVRGEQIGHRATNDLLFCPCQALARIARHLRRHRAPPLTPIYTYYNKRDNRSNSTSTITPQFITNGLRYAARDLHETTGIDPALVSVRSLRPGGATALLCAGVDTSTIQLLGCWRSEAMLRYLRVAATTVTHQHSQAMLDHGDFSFAPGSYTSRRPELLPQQTPDAVRALIDQTNQALNIT